MGSLLRLDSKLGFGIAIAPTATGVSRPVAIRNGIKVRGGNPRLDIGRRVPDLHWNRQEPGAGLVGGSSGRRRRVAQPYAPLEQLTSDSSVLPGTSMPGRFADGFSAMANLLVFSSPRSGNPDIWFCCKPEPMMIW